MECSPQTSVYTTNEVRHVQQEQWMTKHTPPNGVKGTASNLTSANHVMKINIRTKSDVTTITTHPA